MEASLAFSIGREAFANSVLGESGSGAVDSIIVEESKGVRVADSEVTPLGADLDDVLLANVALGIDLSVKLPEGSLAG